MKLKRTGILTKIIIIALLIYAVATLVKLRGQVQEAEARKTELMNTVAAVTAKNDELQYAIDHRGDDAVMEDIARSEGYIYQDEEVYYAE